MTRLRSLDSLRGLAALAVVVCHSLIFIYKSAPWLPYLISVPPLSLFVTAGGAVLLFYILSGYVLALSLGDNQPSEWGIFVVRRVCRIWPTYLVVLLASAGLGTVATTISSTAPPRNRGKTPGGQACALRSLTRSGRNGTSAVAALSLAPR